MTLSAMEFLRRFVQHILPRGFVRIRQSGFLASAYRTARVALARTLLAQARPPVTSSVAATETPPQVTWTCPRCGASMILGPVLTALQLTTLTLGFDTCASPILRPTKVIDVYVAGRHSTRRCEP
jgi:hypothetical protein